MVQAMPRRHRQSDIMRRRFIEADDEMGRKHAGGLTGLLVMLSLVPVLYCGIFNYASADDFSKSYTVHNVLLAGGNVLDAIYASIQAAANVWRIWEGTWASNFFLAFQPSIWGEHAYSITVPLCILYTAAGTGYALRELLVQRLGMTKKAYWVIFWLQLFLSAIYAVYPGRNVLVHWYGTLCHANVFFSVNDCLDAEVGADGETPVSDFYASGRSVSGRVPLSAHHSGSSDSLERLALEPFDGKESSAENVSSVDSDHRNSDWSLFLYHFTGKSDTWRRGLRAASFGNSADAIFLYDSGTAAYAGIFCACATSHGVRCSGIFSWGPIGAMG